MRRVLLALVSVFVLTAPAVAGAAEGNIIVQRAPGVDGRENRALREDAGVELVTALRLERTELVQAAPGRLDDALTALRADSDVVYAEVNRRLSVSYLPDDSAWGSLWGLRNTGQLVGGQAGDAGDDIGATEAWDRSKGAGVTVAVVDTGVNADHVDLVAQIAGNAAETGGVAGIDDDLNGYVDDYRGWDFVSGDNLPQDGHGHGTHVSGTIAAQGSNATGVIGVAPLATVMPLRALGNDGTGYTDGIAAAFDYAGDLGVPIVNASLGGEYSETIERVIADHPDTLYVVGAGNKGVDADSDGEAYPCALTAANLICTGASDNRDEPASFSNYGDTAVDLFAPGVGIYSTAIGSATAYTTKSGTSMAAPHVAGAAALALAASPGASTAFLRWALLSSVEAQDALSGRAVTGGRLNANAAIGAILGPDLTQPPIPTPEPPVATPPPAAPVATPTPTPVVVRPAVLTNVKVGGSLKTKRGKLRVTFSLDRAAPVIFVVTRRNSKQIVGTWTIRGRAGQNSAKIARRLPSGRTLSSGAYRLTVGVSATVMRSSVIRVP